MRKHISPDSPESKNQLCCILIEMGTIGSYIHNTLGPYTIKQAEDWLAEIGFVQHRPNLWFQNVPMMMDYCGTDITLKDAQAWVRLLHKPEEINFRRT